MGMISVVPFEPWHLEVLNPWSDPCFTGFMRENPAYRELLKAYGPAFSGFTVEGDYLGSVGFIRFPWGSSVEIWMVLDANIRNCKKEFHRFIKERIRFAFETMNATRFQAIVEASDTRACRWIEALGFVRETKDEGMRNFGPNGVSVHMYGRWI